MRMLSLAYFNRIQRRRQHSADSQTCYLWMQPTNDRGMNLYTFLCIHSNGESQVAAVILVQPENEESLRYMVQYFKNSKKTLIGVMSRQS